MPMPLEELRGAELAIWLKGYQAARAGQPFNEHADDRWGDGYRYSVQQNTEKKEKQACH